VIAIKSVRAVVVPVGGANFGSLRHACERLDVPIEFTADPMRIQAASHILLPGVGAADPAIAGLRERGLDRVLTRLTQPLLGICLGMQLLFQSSEEGNCNLLGFLPGHVRRLAPAPVWPHMGWNTLMIADDHPLLQGINPDDWFYFVHGYAAASGPQTIACCDFGGDFAAVVARGNVMGVQFHPEKSSWPGLRLLANFFAL